jgi:hypothetical protein
MAGSTAGWQTDVNNPDQQRWWDGEAWTDVVRPRVKVSPRAVAHSGPSYTKASDEDFYTNPHWLLSGLASVVCFPFGLIALTYSVMTVRATALYNTELADRYALYAQRLALACMALTLVLGVAAVAIGIGSKHLVLNDVGVANVATAVAITDTAFYNVSETAQTTPITIAEISAANDSNASVSSDRTSVVKFTFPDGAKVCVSIPVPEGSPDSAQTHC